MNFNEAVEYIGKAMDLAGVGAIVVGALLATAFFVTGLRRGEKVEDRVPQLPPGRGSGHPARP